MTERIRKPGYWHRYWRTLFSDAVILLILAAGVAILIFGIPHLGDQQSHTFQLEKLAQLDAQDANFPKINSHYPIRRLEQFKLGYSGQEGRVVQVAHYRDTAGQQLSAMIYWPTPEILDPERTPLETDLQRWRQRAWQVTLQSIEQRTEQKSLFLSWWDNAQRIHLYTGRNTWANAPAAQAYSEADQRELWNQLSGGVTEDSERLQQLAHWLTMDAEQALLDIRTQIQSPEYHFLVCMDDLARLTELSALVGQILPFETRLFPPGKDIHSLIAGVKRWADEKGNGHYLVQKLPAGRVRAWRITSTEGEKMLLARLLPFTSSLANPLKGAELVYRSKDWSGYLSVHRISSL